METTRTSKLAVIITTHYIEEARQANTVGFSFGRHQKLPVITNVQFTMKNPHFLSTTDWTYA